jgi:sugar lactone lactonase YvrE
VKNLLRFTVFAVVPLLALVAAPADQKIETVDGVRVVHNVKGGLWGKTPQISLELVRKIGDIDTEDEHAAFNFPSDVAVDKDGNIYILDTGNTRIQKFGPDGRYLATIGRKGQGPGEFIMPDGIDFDRDGNLVVGDSAQSRLHVIIGGGKDSKAVILKDERLYGLRCLAAGGYIGRASTYALPMPDRPVPKVADMRLFRKLAPDGRVAGSFGALTDFGEAMTNAAGNTTETAVGAGDALLVTYTAQNRIEKFGPDGQLLWRADRPLDYGTDVKKKGKIDTSGGKFSMSSPEMNNCSAGVAVDAGGRIWVLTYARQLRKEEQVQTSMMGVSAGAGVDNVSIKTEGNTDLRTTDAFKLEIFDADGALLGEIPLTHFADVLRVAGDRLFLIDRERGVTVYQYNIVDK